MYTLNRSKRSAVRLVDIYPKHFLSRKTNCNYYLLCCLPVLGLYGTCLQISDFGLAKMRGISSQTTRRSRRGRQNPSGTLSFIAPERFTGETDPTKGQKIDVYG